MAVSVCRMTPHEIVGLYGDNDNNNNSLITSGTARSPDPINHTTHSHTMTLFTQIARLARAQPRIHLITPRRSIGSVSAIDSSIFRTLFGTEEIRKVICQLYHAKAPILIPTPGLRR